MTQEEVRKILEKLDSNQLATRNYIKKNMKDCSATYDVNIMKMIKHNEIEEFSILDDSNFHKARTGLRLRK